jgi:hypothetical protein
LNNQTDGIYLNVSRSDKEGKPFSSDKSFDILAQYTCSYASDAIVLEVTPSSFGSLSDSLSSLLFPLKESLRITIPLDTSASDVFDSVFLDLMNNDTVLKENLQVESMRYSIDFIFDFSDLDLLDKNVTELPTTSYSYIHEGDNNYMIFNQADLVFDLLPDDSPLEKKIKGVKTKIMYNSQGKSYLRLTDQVSGFSFDAALTLDINDISGTPLTRISAIKPYSPFLSEEVTASLSSLYEETFSGKSLPSLEGFEVLDYEVSENEIRFHVKQTSWTIMIYMNGSDLESTRDANGKLYGKATEDLNEMIKGLTSSNINLIIETGGTLEWKMDGIRSDINQRFKIENGELIHLEDLEMKNMTAPETLIDFANYAIDTYPSEKYALLMWNHGGGSLYGFGVDEYLYDDSLTLDELEYALDEVTRTNDMTFEVIGFDACLMATLETATACAPYAEYLIASEETEPDYGWDYFSMFTTLADGDAYDGNSFGQLVVTSFMDYSIAADQEEMLTLSVIDLSEVKDVIEAFDSLIKTISDDASEQSNTYAPVSKIIPQTKAFGGNTEYSGYTDHYDLKNFASKLESQWPNQSQLLLKEIDEAVVHKASGYLAQDAGGISFYLPYYDLFYEDEIDDMYEAVSFSDIYTQFMADFVDYRLASSYETSDLSYIVDSSNDPYELIINYYSLDYVSNVYMNVYLINETDEDITYTDLGYDAWVSETDTPGVYEDSFSFWPSINNQFLPIQVVYDGDDYIEYETPIYLNGEQATMISGWLYEEERYVIFGARPNNQSSDGPVANNGIVDRYTIDFEDGDVVEILSDHYSTLLDEWTFITLQTITVDTETFNIRDSKFLSGDYGIQFVIEDSNGEFTFTDLIEFSN